MIVPNPFIWIQENILGLRASNPDNPPLTSEDINGLFDRIDSMRAPIISCNPQIDGPSTRADESRLGGWPGWPDGEALPKDGAGQPMLFLCQINFAEMPPLDPFPDAGLMQIFVADDGQHGCTFPSENRNGFSVVYRNDAKGLTTVDPYGAGNGPNSTVFSGDLQRNGRRFTFELQDMIPPPVIYPIAIEIESLSKRGNWRSDLSRIDKYVDDYFIDRPGPDVYLGGYPRFTQHDIREPNHLDYDQVIMQFGAPPDMMWGDVGEACFLMRRDDLSDRRFEKAIYSWDCT